MTDQVYILNQKTRSGIGGALPDGYLDEDSAIEMAKALAHTFNGRYKELPIDKDRDDDAIVFRCTDGDSTFEVIRLRIAY